jgi:AraC family transcriptional regulator
VQRFVAWSKAAGLSLRTNPTFNVWRSERRPANLANYSVDLCVGVDANHPIDTRDETVRVGEIPGGRCAVLRVTDDTHNLEPAAPYLYRDWLPVSGEEMRDFPLYCQRLLLDDPAECTAAELFLPLR